LKRLGAQDVEPRIFVKGLVVHGTLPVCSRCCLTCSMARRRCQMQGIWGPGLRTQTNVEHRTSNIQRRSPCV
jgi:hypothetical protein